MSALAMLAVVPLSLGAIALAVRIWADHQKEKMKLRAIQIAASQARAGVAVQQQRRIAEELQDRVRVLEHIVADKGLDVDMEIERLRTARAA